MGIWYTTLEAVKTDLDFKETAHNDAQVRRAIEAASRSVDGLMLRTFWPQIATRYFDFPNKSYAAVWQLWLDENELVSLDVVTSGGDVIAPANYILYPDNGPPYNQVQLDRSSSAVWGSGSTPQNDICLTGLFGYTNVEIDGGTITQSLAVTGASVEVSDSAAIGIGSLIRVDDERMSVQSKSMVDTTQNLGTSLTEDMSNEIVAVSTGSAFTEGEIILIDAEKMRITDIAGNNLIVTRAWDGSTLSAHTAPADIYCPRLLSVIRADVGTVVAVHADNAAVNLWTPPALIEELTAAEACHSLIAKRSGFTGSSGGGDSARKHSLSELEDLRQRCLTAHGRFLRAGAV